VPRALATLGALLALLGAAAGRTPAPAQGAVQERTVVDGAGRRVEVPARVERVFAAGGPASIMLYTLAPERLLGWTRAPSPEEAAFLPERWAARPALGRLTGRGNTANVEVVLAARPDVIVDYGSLAGTYVSLADRVQAQTGVPYLLLDGRLDAVPAVYRALGALLDLRERAETLARHAERLLADTDRQVTGIPAGERPRVYYARGPRGLETGRAGSVNVESLTRVGARNVAGEGLGGGGLATVSFEQVLAWDPDVVVTIERDFAAAAPADALWGRLRAVRQGRVHVAPGLPFPWIDFPPSVNRLIGLRWLGRVLYPARFTADLRAEARDFYTRFYHRAPAERQLDALLAGAAPARR
jgi:iron complex transport system substrate-binding protein